MNLDDALAALKRVKEGAKQSMSHGREDYREALKRAYVAEGRDTDGAKINQMLGSNRTVTMIRDLMGVSKPKHREARESMGLGLSDDKATRIGQILGTIESDIVQDRGRELWWLLNAPQAAVNVVQDIALHKHAPEMYKTKIETDITGTPITSKQQAMMNNLIDQAGRPKAGVNISYEKVGGSNKPIKVYRKRIHDAGFVDHLAIPAGFAVNQGIGLMNPFGGQEGYKAVIPDEEDPTKTDNVLAEVASKYILGRTGNLLPWSEFQKVRPDVSKDEYMRYKAFKHDNNMDLNVFDDGEVVLPTGVLKWTEDGIHGSELQFLGRSMPLNTALLPTAAAIAGTAFGARGHGRFKGSPGRGLAYGMASTAVGMVAGTLLEQERRRRNAAENANDTIN